MVSDPNTKGMHYGFGCSVSHGRKGKGMGGHTWRMVVAGEDLAKDGAARPVVAARKERPREGKRETEVKAWSGERKRLAAVPDS